jgi:hypothetical protein
LPFMLLALDALEANSARSPAPAPRHCESYTARVMLSRSSWPRRVALHCMAGLGRHSRHLTEVARDGTAPSARRCVTSELASPSCVRPSVLYFTRLAPQPWQPLRPARRRRHRAIGKQRRRAGIYTAGDLNSSSSPCVRPSKLLFLLALDAFGQLNEVAGDVNAPPRKFRPPE